MNNQNEEQFSRIYDQYVEKIYRFVYVKVNSRETAEDLTSKVFLKIWQSYQNGQKIQNSRAFLYQVARNTVIDYYRENNKKRALSINQTKELADLGKNIEEKAMIDNDMVLVISAIQKIKKNYQDVILWHYLEDMSPREIGEIIGKPVGTVRVMLHRGLKSLRNELNNLG